LLLQCIGDLGNQLAAGAAHIGERRKDPHRRCAKRDDAENLDGVAGSPPREEILLQRIRLPVHPLDAANLLDDEAQRRVDEVPVKLAAAHGIGQDDFTNFACRPRAEPQRRAHDPLGQ
jgi:hypothetical protein